MNNFVHITKDYHDVFFSRLSGLGWINLLLKASHDTTRYKNLVSCVKVEIFRHDTTMIRYDVLPPFQLEIGLSFRSTSKQHRILLIEYEHHFKSTYQGQTQIISNLAQTPIYEVLILWVIQPINLKLLDYCFYLIKFSLPLRKFVFRPLCFPFFVLKNVF